MRRPRRSRSKKSSVTPAWPTPDLPDKGKADVATPMSLARYAVAQVRAGRQVGNSLNCNDITSVCCRRRNGVQVESLSSWNEQHGEWQEVLVEDKSVTPADLAASRIDYPAFLSSLNQRDCRIAETLSRGESTGRAAELFDISPARVSQLRQELKNAWDRFHGSNESRMVAVAYR